MYARVGEYEWRRGLWEFGSSSASDGRARLLDDDSLDSIPVKAGQGDTRQDARSMIGIEKAPRTGGWEGGIAMKKLRTLKGVAKSEGYAPLQTADSFARPH